MKPIHPENLVALMGRWPAGRGPLYLLLAARLRQLIEEGHLAAETLLPADRALAAQLAVGRSTVVAAYDLLREEGKLARRQGSGTWVAGPALAIAPPEGADNVNPMFLQLLDPPDDLHAMTCAAPDTPVPEVRFAYERAAAELAGICGDIGYYPQGHPRLRRTIADHYTRRRGLPTGPEQIMVTSGAQQALSLVIRMCVAAGDTVLHESPTYPGALDLFRDAAAVSHCVPVGGQGLDVDACLAAMTEHRPALTYLVPTFHNPTGTVVSPMDRRRFAEAATRHDLVLLDDEALAMLDFRAAAPPPLAAYAPDDHVITTGSLSKLAWGGMRVGWMRASAAVIARLARMRAIHDLGGDVPSQLAACHLFGALDTLAPRRRAEIMARHDHLCAELARALPEWEYTRAEGGQTVWVRLPRGEAAAFAQVAMRYGVAVLPGDALDPANRPSARLRLPFLASEDALTDAVDRLAAAWGAYTGTRVSTTSLNAIVV